MRQEILVLLAKVWIEEYINEGLVCRDGEWWTIVTVVCGLAVLCPTGFCDISKTLLSSPGSPMKTEAEIRACMSVVYLAKSPQESGERDWDEGNWEGGQANEGSILSRPCEGIWGWSGWACLRSSSQNDHPSDGRGNSYAQVPHKVLTPSFFLWH